MTKGLSSQYPPVVISLLSVNKSLLSYGVLGVECWVLKLLGRCAFWGRTAGDLGYSRLPQGMARSGSLFYNLVSRCVKC